MATAAYAAWVAAGRPWRNARPVKETLAQLRAAYPDTVVGSIGDQAHLQAAVPKDHTPFPANPWPVPLPPLPGGYVVCATDYMHNTGGLDCHLLFARLIDLCRSGQRPWTKYLIWQGKRYDVRNGWVPVGSSGHFDHIHESIRSDCIDMDTSPYPNPFLRLEDDMTPDEHAHLVALANRVRAAVLRGDDTLDDVPGDGKAHPVWLVRTLKTLAADVDELRRRPPVVVDAVALTAAMAASPEFVGALAGQVAARLPVPPSDERVRAIVDEELDEQARAGADDDSPSG